MNRFFSDKIYEDKIIICGEDCNHITKVLRLSKKDIIIVCDGSGNDYTASIVDIAKQQVTASIVNSQKNLAEPKVKITLFQCLPKSSKMDYVIEKTVELGVNEIVPVISDRVVSKLSDVYEKTEYPERSEKTDKTDKKLIRWNNISLSAAKQSGRGIIPKVSSPVSFEKAILMMNHFDKSFLAYEEASNGENSDEEKKIAPLKKIIGQLNNILNIGIMVGPEGGFEPREIELAHKHGIEIIGLGHRILRTETAGLAIISILMYQLEEI